VYLDLLVPLLEDNSGGNMVFQHAGKLSLFHTEVFAYIIYSWEMNWIWGT